MRRAGWAAAAVVVGWYVFALAILHPLTDAPVVDSWLYGSAVRRYLRTGEIRFAGYSQATPIAQVVYGVAWAHVFGGNSASLELSVVALAVLCGVMFHALALKCGAPRWQALAATGLLICNPCFMFLSFSFMTEIPFLTAIVAAHLAFANAEGRRAQLWLWLAAALSAIAFLIRPFGAMVIAGCVGAMILYDTRLRGMNLRDRAVWAEMLVPFGAALAICAGVWIGLTVLGPKPWEMQLNENHFRYIFRVPLANYLRAGVLGPALYLGTVLSPLAILQLTTPRWRRVVMGGAGIFAAAMLLMWMDNRMPVTPEYSCFGGWHNVLILRGQANRFSWNSDWQYAFLILASFGAAGLLAAFAGIFRTLGRSAAAILIAATIYWLATIPLWFYNDRYYLVLVPAGAIVMALAPLPRRRLVMAAGFAMTFAMGLMSLGGTYAYQRGMAAILATRNELERKGVPRSAIDAGYALNGEDLYRYPKHGIDTMKLEAGIPMITSEKVGEYTIASEPIAGMEVVERLEWPGPFGLGHRYFYLVKTPAAHDGNPPTAAPAAPQPKN
ncbi:MAG: glycosyltransferase family 39 protein [Candidatus Binatus sp.]|uniref:ArnT family glycosyltransferase n=1 Tax=Candidatus Binatus sp. TaxID=2811406 RepID=UPI003C78C5C0